MHAGPVVAGVGQERHQFDIWGDTWGDTVNVPARMVGMSSPGSIAVTKETFEQVSLRWRIARRTQRQRQRRDPRLRMAHP